MQRTRIVPELDLIPDEFHNLLRSADVYDSSSSAAARVYFIDRDGGCYLKSAPRGTLEAESRMTAYFHSLKLGPEVLGCVSREKDWLLTRAVPGEDCTHRMYTEDPRRLSELLGQTLRQLHSLDISQCPVNRLDGYVADAAHNYRQQRYDASLFPDNWGYASAEEAWAVIREMGGHLKADTLIHGDYCMPNVMLQDWRLSGFIDLGSAGIADRHIDLFWGAWSLDFNLKTDRWHDRFLDAYGRERVDEALLRLVAAYEVFE